MVSDISTLFVTLDRYVRQDLTLEALQDQFSLGLQEYFDQASEEDIELLSEIHSAIYEVEDSLLDEEELRRAVKELIAGQLHSPTITVGNLPRHTNYHHSYVGTSSSSGDLRAILRAA